MDSRLELHALLLDLLGSGNVYFQPPPSDKLKYPAIVYTRSDIDNAFADSVVYRQSFRYEITVIDRNPDSDIVSRVSALPRCRFDRHFTSDNLNHDVFSLYF